MNIAMLLSGGVDSAVAAHKLIEQGHNLHCFYIRIGMKGDGGDCSAEEDIEMCTLIARRYGLPFDVVSLHQEYWDNVMEYALRTVKQGLTPNPDIMCNVMIKFGFFEQRWGREFDRTATGHYASKIEEGGLDWLATAVDPVKDQTDFLARISYEQLHHALFPLGSIPKSQVRQIAIDAHLPNALRKDSQGICFLGKINYADFIRQQLGERPGPIIEIETGRKIGTHKGFWFHTIGQRKGLGLSGGPWYVVKKNVHDNVIYVSNGYDTEKQYGNVIYIDNTQFITADPWGDGCNDVAITFKNRHMPQFLPGKITRLAPGEYRIESASPVQGIAPGQFVALYDAAARICYGSGIITLPAPDQKL